MSVVDRLFFFKIHSKGEVKMNIEGEYYLLYCAVANVALLSTLGNNKLLESDYYKRLEWPWGNDSNNVLILKEVLEQARFGNPVMLLMQYYTLLVMPKQLTSDYESFCKDDFNNMFDSLKETVNTTYDKDNGIPNYYRHLRNALSHSHYEFYSVDNEKYVKFWDYDQRANSDFETVILYSNAALLLDHLCGKMMEYLNIFRNNSDVSYT